MVRIVSQALYCLLAVSIAWAAESAVTAETDPPPWHLKVYSKDGRESLAASCSPKDLSIDRGSQTEVTCKFVNVRFQLPPKGSGIADFPTALEEYARMNPETADEIRKDPQKAKEDLEKGVRETKEYMCSAESKSHIEAQIRDPSMGPKRKRLFEEFIRACSERDPHAVFNVLPEFERRTCGLWVDQFSLDFRKIGEGRWLYTQDRPGLLSNALKVYELTGGGMLWTLTETRMPMNKRESGEAQKESQRTVWSWKNRSEYEIPAQCDFISHKSVQAPN